MMISILRTFKMTYHQIPKFSRIRKYLDNRYPVCRFNKQCEKHLPTTPMCQGSMLTCICECTDCVVCPWQNDMTDMHSLVDRDDEACDTVLSYNWSVHTVGLHVKHTKICSCSYRLTIVYIWNAHDQISLSWTFTINLFTAKLGTCLTYGTLQMLTY